jgi:hypothetical protein
MINRTLLLLVFLCFGPPAQFYAQAPQPTKLPYVYKCVSDTSCAIEVAFGSYGSGIDGKALEKVHAVLAKYKVKYTSKAIGREGETRICLPLKELRAKKKKALLADLKKIAKKSQLVSVSIR